MAQAPDPQQTLTPAPSTLPRHIAIIMDGNNRWLKQRGGSGLTGHRAGAESVRTVIRLCAEKHIECLTLFAFSSENWQRPEQEVSGLMSLFTRFLQKKEVGELHRNGIRLSFIGNRSRFSQELQGLMRDAEQMTKANTGLHVTIAADYGGRWDITQAARALALQVKVGTLDPDAIDEAAVHKYTALANLPPPDLCIRTGGEFRISNFLLWQFAYTELHFTPTFWPDFGAADLDMALADFASRQRRYGKVSEQIELEQARGGARA
ncbi:MAG: polyprenyl diphosphate synthase [Pseudomonadota bacterium]|nr:polyprenyl diphosphate synthase [Pseudomonadota bacterium]